MKTRLFYNPTIIRRNAENGRDIKINISLSVDKYFSITADTYSKGARGGWRFDGCGCQHEKINKYAPKFAPFISLHLSDVWGAPSLAVENSITIFNTKGRAAGAEYLRIDPDSAAAAALESVAKLDDKKYFAYILQNSGIVENWAKEAAAAVSLLESWTGAELDRENKPRNFPPLSADELAEIENVKNSLSGAIGRPVEVSNELNR